MNKHSDYDTSYDLEKRLSQSLDKVTDNIVRQHRIKREIIKLRRQRRQLENIPDDVRQWFEETEGLEDDEEA